jgi:hypothetical protein
MRLPAALALGTVPTKAACDALLEALDDDDPWVRYGAYRSLKKISGESHFADWIFGAKGERDAAVSAWKEWRQKKDGELKG